MEKLFIDMATSQIALYFVLEFGLSRGMLKKDTYMTMAKISSFIVFITSGPNNIVIEKQTISANKFVIIYFP